MEQRTFKLHGWTKFNYLSRSRYLLFAVHFYIGIRLRQKNSYFTILIFFLNFHTYVWLQRQFVLANIAIDENDLGFHFSFIQFTIRKTIIIIVVDSFDVRVCDMCICPGLPSSFFSGKNSITNIFHFQNLNSYIKKIT